jgi:2-polyprenyl-6-hydroxyphenyl methylase/3-demethylubiquinone-9 3-methyltransferase
MVEHPGSADHAELKRFERLAGAWWDEAGPMAPLHKLNPVRLAYIRDQLCRHLGLDPKDHRALAGQNVLDIGCGGGLLCEPLARQGATVTGIDLVPANLVAARHHARAAGLEVAYRDVAAEQLAAEGARFDLVCAMEVVEHVADVRAFLATCATLVRPGGALVLATLNRTLRSFALGIVAAEYILGWLPRGTHQWERFITPDELARHLAAAGLAPPRFAGMSYDLLRDAWSLTSDTDVNYLAAAARAALSPP